LKFGLPLSLEEKEARQFEQDVMVNENGRMDFEDFIREVAKIMGFSITTDVLWSSLENDIAGVELLRGSFNLHAEVSGDDMVQRATQEQVADILEPASLDLDRLNSILAEVKVADPANIGLEFDQFCAVFFDN
jgi:hypothetical protein